MEYDPKEKYKKKKKVGVRVRRGERLEKAGWKADEQRQTRAQLGSAQGGDSIKVKIGGGSGV